METYEYDGNDNLTKRITPKLDQIVFAYDAVNQLLSKTLPGNHVTSYTYSPVGNLLTVTDPDSLLAMTYDQANRLLSTNTSGSPNQPAVTLGYSYDKNGNRVGLADPTRLINSRYDMLNRLTAIGTAGATGTAAPAVLVSWPADGTAQDAVGGQHGTLQNGATFATGILGQAFTFDGLDDYVNVPDSPLLDSLTGAVTIEAWMKPDPLVDHPRGYLFSRRDPNLSEGLSLSVVEDGRLELIVRTTTSPTVSGTVFGTPVGTITFGQWQHVAATVDPANGMAKVWVNGQEVPLISTFGPATLSGTLVNVNNLFIGRREAPGTVGGVDVGGHYKGLIDDLRVYQRVLTAGEILASVNVSGTTFAYDALSRRTSLTLPNGTQTTYSYDPASQVTNILHQLTATATQINQAAYAYNHVGNRTSVTDPRGAQSFGYDSLDRLTSASHPLLATPQAFAYDAVGNRTTGGSVVNAGNQLTADATHTYQYDDNGNLTRKTLLVTGNFTQYTYDAENRLTKVEDFTAGNPTPAFTSTYRYDSLGRRIEKVANGQTKRYIYNGEDILLEYDGTNTLQARYTHGPGIDEPLAVTKGVSTFFYHQDGLGSVTDLTDAAGATAKSYSYNAYGNIVDQTGTVEQPYTYTGRELDSETGLYHYRARYYDSQIGRFLQKDPMGFVGPEMNAYSYVTNNPANFADPMGLKRRKWQGVTAYVPSDPYQYPNQMIGGDELGATVCKANAVWYWIRQDILDDKEDGRCGITECLIRHETQHVDDVVSINKSVCQGAPDNAKVFVDPSVGLEREGHKIEKDCLVEKLKNPSCGCEIRLTQRLVKVQANLSGRLK